eukprot:7326281-Lingulodinium_polyedra.AAC.1
MECARCVSRSWRPAPCAARAITWFWARRAAPSCRAATARCGSCAWASARRVPIRAVAFRSTSRTACT